jgi:indolepyruvate ferredoxin oxidoreductase beta subunit
MNTVAEPSQRDRMTIAIFALGGQGGGVLADWVVDIADRSGFIAQATSVPGVAQRTGSTVYYVELYPADPADTQEPVLALMPAPGDVNIVIASELMEAGRSILRGFATEKTLLIGSTHRIYAIGEKAALADGRASSDRILEAARTRTGRFIGFDMDEIASRTGSVISSVMFGALAGSGALPISREVFEEAIRAGGKGVKASLAAFALGFEEVQTAPPAAEPENNGEMAAATTAAGAELAAQIDRQLPEDVRSVGREGVKRLMDYQDRRYAELYLERLSLIASVDRQAGEWRLTAAVAKHLALWMSYEDTIRVADLKIRASRFQRVRSEVRAPDTSILYLTEYMHPRPQEVCETLPVGLGQWILANRPAMQLLDRILSKGRYVRTTSLAWFVVLSLVASLRRRRRGTLRYAIEQERIEHWLHAVHRSAAAGQYEAAIELAECQRLIKGYGETHERGLANYGRIMAKWPALRTQPDAAQQLKRLREAALADEEGRALSDALNQVAA